MTTRASTRLPDFDRLMTVAALSFGAYIVYQLVQGLGQVKQSAQAVATALVPKPTGSASIVLASDGTEIPFDSVTFDPWYTHWSGTYFRYKGLHYQFSSETPDETNTYYAVQVP